METTEKPKDPNDPREYTAIPDGGKLLAAGAAFPAFAILSLTPPVLRTMGLATMLLCVTLVIIVVIKARDIAQWLKSYWLRNVRGYRLACWIGNDPSDRRELRYAVIAPGNVLKSDGVSACTIVLPLGGWFRKSASIVAPEKEGYPWLWGSVRLRLQYPLRSFDDIGGRSVQITDRHGDRLTVTVQRALELFELHGVNVLTRALDGWRSAFDLACERSERFVGEISRQRAEHAQRMDALFRILDAAGGQAAPPTGGDLTDWLAVQVRRLIAERDAARGEVDRFKDGFLPAAVKDRDAARQEREEAVAFIAGLDRLFEESSRLHDKLQALRIHERIRERLYFHRFPTAWETSVANAAQQHDADAGALAEVRARIKEYERRDRRRHGKGAAPAAT